MFVLFWDQSAPFWGQPCERAAGGGDGLMQRFIEKLHKNWTGKILKRMDLISMCNKICFELFGFLPPPPVPSLSLLLSISLYMYHTLFFYLFLCRLFR